MLYELMHRDVEVADINITTMGKVTEISTVYNIEHMPLGTVIDGGPDAFELNDWWCRRTIPSSRQGLQRFLETVGLPNAEALLTKSYGLSLSDQYWVRNKPDMDWKSMNFPNLHFILLPS